MAPGIKGIQAQKQLSKRQPYPADQGRRVQRSGHWGIRPAVALQCAAKGPAVPRRRKDRKGAGII